MSNISNEILRNHINYEKFISSTEVLTAMKGRFKDVLQEPSEAEMDSQLGYDKYNISEKQAPNSRNSYSKNTVKSKLGADWCVVKNELNCFIMIR